MLKLRGRRLKRFQNSENFVFLKRLIRNPRALGAIAPSSKYLARFICNHIHYKDGDYIVEIGAGTGRFTRALLQSGIPSSKLIVIELDKELAKYLKMNFPNLMIIQGDATLLSTVLPEHIIGKVKTIISGIPMVNLPKRIQKEIVDACFEVLDGEGSLLQFTYGPISPISTKDLGVFGMRLGRVLQNIPPASIWRYTKNSLQSPYASYPPNRIKKIWRQLKKNFNN